MAKSKNKQDDSKRGSFDSGWRNQPEQDFLGA